MAKSSSLYTVQTMADALVELDRDEFTNNSRHIYSTNFAVLSFNTKVHHFKSDTVVNRNLVKSKKYRLTATEPCMAAWPCRCVQQFMASDARRYFRRAV